MSFVIVDWLKNDKLLTAALYFKLHCKLASILEKKIGVEWVFGITGGGMWTRTKTVPECETFIVTKTLCCWLGESTVSEKQQNHTVDTLCSIRKQARCRKTTCEYKYCTFKQHSVPSASDPFVRGTKSHKHICCQGWTPHWEDHSDSNIHKYTIRSVTHNTLTVFTSRHTSLRSTFTSLRSHESLVVRTLTIKHLKYYKHKLLDSKGCVHVKS